MAEWRSPRELLDLTLAGLPRSDRGILKWSRRQGWESRLVMGLGGKRLEYLVPDVILAMQPEPEISNSKAAESESDELAAKAIWGRFHRSSAKKQRKAVEKATALRVRRGLIEAPEGFRQLSERTIRWCRNRVKDHEDNPSLWPALLIDDRFGRPRVREYSSRVDDLFRADFSRPERPSASYDRIKGIAAGENLQLPAMKTLIRRMRADVPWQSIRLARYGAKALEATYPAQERDRSVFRSLEALNADGWRADNLVEWPGGEVGRPILLSWQDLYSGAIVGWRVDRTENLDLIRLSFGDMLRSYGIPDEVFLDKGYAFSGMWLSGRTPKRFRFKIRAEEPDGIFNLLGIKVHWVMPHHGQAKPIERAHGEYADRISRHPLLAGSWLGPNTVDRPEIREPVSLAEFLEVVDVEVKSHNEGTGRRAKNCAGRSFWETFKDGYERGPVRRATAEQLALALMAVEGVKVSSRDGTFRLAGDNRYYSEVVGQFAGQTIAVRFDPQNLKSQVFCYRLTGESIGIAKCIEPIGFNDTEAARVHARLKRQNLKAHKQILTNERRMSTGELVELLPTVSAAPELLKSKIVRLTPRLSIAAPAAVNISAQRNDGDWHWNYYRSLKARRPETLDADERAAIRIYESKAEYRIRMRELEVEKAS